MQAQDVEAFESNLVVGYTTQDHLLLDLDRIDHYKAVRLGRMIQRDFPDVGAGLLVRSSPAHYHLVYDKRLSWDRIVSIIQTLVELGIVERNYAHVRTFRRDLTLRVSPKRGVDRFRPSPEPAGMIRSGVQDAVSYGIPSYLAVLGTFNRFEPERLSDERKTAL